MTPRGYTERLYILPFDHRHSYGAEVFGYHEPMSPAQIADVAASKQVIYDGFRLALERGVPTANAGILVDEEFGADILRDAVRRGYLVAMSTEKSGQIEFDFEYGDDFARHLEQFHPTFAKALVRYNPQGSARMNSAQAARLARMSEYLQTSSARFMFELLVPPEDAQLKALGGDRRRYDAEVRPGLVVAAIEQLQDAGVEPDVWKIEGLDSAEDCQRVVAAVRRGGRDKVGCIVLGRGEDERKVLEWLRVAAAVPGFIGFAVGRSSFLDAIQGLRHEQLSRDAAVSQIADRYVEWCREFTQAAGGG